MNGANDLHALADALEEAFDAEGSWGFAEDDQVLRAGLLAICAREGWVDVTPEFSQAIVDAGQVLLLDDEGIDDEDEGDE